MYTLKTHANRTQTSERHAEHQTSHRYTRLIATGSIRTPQSKTLKIDTFTKVTTLKDAVVVHPKTLRICLDGRIGSDRIWPPKF